MAWRDHLPTLTEVKGSIGFAAFLMVLAHVIAGLFGERWGQATNFCVFGAILVPTYFWIRSNPKPN